ncbi:MAG: hypothetical protein IH851_13445 [Armatimonadetes bacterium]|nr:hypothetical protein [Armatimonadota bacterium]
MPWTCWRVSIAPELLSPQANLSTNGLRAAEAGGYNLRGGAGAVFMIENTEGAWNVTGQGPVFKG